jgi:signal peptidase II
MSFQDRKLDWYWTGIFPFVTILILDQAIKLAAFHFNATLITDFVMWKPILNRGMMLGAFSSIPELYRVVSLSTVGLFLVFAFVFIQVLAPIRSRAFRLGLSLFGSAILGNIIDRARLGGVMDFIALKFGNFQTGIFNFADAVQWVGVVLIFFALIKRADLIWPVHERRGRKWIHPEFQGKLILMLGFAGISCLFITGVLSYSYLLVTLKSMIGTDMLFVQQSAMTFALLFSISSTVCVMSLLYLGLVFSHRIVGPVKSFERFLEDVLEGRDRDFKLRAGDEMSHLEEVALRFKQQLHQKLGINPDTLKPGDATTELTAKTYDSKEFYLVRFRGKKLWLCLYRHASCPLCLTHLAELAEKYQDLHKRGLEVAAVFESSPESFAKKGGSRTTHLINSTPFPLVADPVKRFYAAFGAQKSFAAVWHFRVFKSLFEGLKKGFGDPKLDGDYDQIPAHILINPDGTVFYAHYGKSISDHIPWSKVEEFVRAKA